jgi:hypothetical protein
MRVLQPNVWSQQPREPVPRRFRLDLVLAVPNGRNLTDKEVFDFAERLARNAGAGASYHGAVVEVVRVCEVDAGEEP